MEDLGVLVAEAGAAPSGQLQPCRRLWRTVLHRPSTGSPWGPTGTNTRRWSGRVSGGDARMHNTDRDCIAVDWQLFLHLILPCSYMTVFWLIVLSGWIEHLIWDPFRSPISEEGFLLWVRDCSQSVWRGSKGMEVSWGPILSRWRYISCPAEDAVYPLSEFNLNFFCSVICYQLNSSQSTLVLYQPTCKQSNYIPDQFHPLFP